MNELLQRQIFISGNGQPRKHLIRVLKNGVALWWAFFANPFEEWKWMAIAATQFDLVERDIEFRHNHMPVIYDKGPFFQNAYALWLDAARPQSRHYQRWHRYQINRSRDIIDLVVWLSADDQVFRERIDFRDQDHPIKGEPDNIQNQFLADYRQYFEYVLSDGAGNPMFSTIHFQTHDILPSALTDKIIDIIFSGR